jgi:Zn-finger nucleic acid-binding protein
MKCPACKKELKPKIASGMTIDICFGGCGGIWFDQGELKRVSALSAASLHSIWKVKTGEVTLTEPRICPRCDGQVLDRKWFSDRQEVEIDQCPKCGGVWLDDGEFSKIYKEIKGAKIEPPGWAVAIAQAAAAVKQL